MQSPQNDETFMAQALALAEATAALASPNPQVGCVLVRHDKVLGEGAHRYADRDHAEIVALQQAAARGLEVAGATAYVTLEPCSHHGRTGPCADALIQARIARCVVATADPNPQVSGRGLAKLRAAGIPVTLGTLEARARQINDAFAHFIQTGSPFITLKAALSVDGMLAPPPAARRPNTPFWLTGRAARAQVQLLRHASDSLISGIGTVLADDPALSDRTNLPRRRPLLRVILDTHLRIPLTAQLVRTAEPGDLLLVCGPTAPTERIAALEGLGIEVLIAPEHAGQLSLAAVLSTLAKRKMTSALLEAGSTLNAAFLRQHHVDRVVLFYAERELGAGALPFARGFQSSFVLEQKLSSLQKQTIGPDVCVSGLLNDPWRTLPDAQPTASRIP